MDKNAAIGKFIQCALVWVCFDHTRVLNEKKKDVGLPRTKKKKGNKRDLF